MISNPKPKGYWTKEKCLKIAKKCQSRSEFQKKYCKAYHVSWRKGWLKEICSSMEFLRKPHGYWDIKENCINAAKKCETKKEFAHKYNPAYNISRNNGWIDEVCSHMIELKKPSGYWNIKENCVNAAKKCETRSEFMINYAGAYKSAKAKGFLNEICSHMTSIYKPYKRWTKEKCFEVAQKCRTKKDFQKKHPGAFSLLRKKGSLNEVSFPISDLRKPNGYWTKEKCVEAVKSCQTKREFRERYCTAYYISCINNWMKEITRNLPRYKSKK